MWVMPVFIASMFLVVLSVWNVMTGRWSTGDWKEVGLSVPCDDCLCVRQAFDSGPARARDRSCWRYCFRGPRHAPPQTEGTELVGRIR